MMPPDKDELRLMKLEKKKRQEDAIRQKSFDRGYRAGYLAGYQARSEEES
jgi:hypothetical protein